MSGKADMRRIGAAALLGAGVVVLPVGCSVAPTESVQTAPATEAQSAAYARAMQSQSPADVTSFIEAYRGSSLSADLLNAMPPATLAKVPRSSVVGLMTQVKRQLDDRVKTAFALQASQSGSDSNGRSGS